jgi:hypothetical protein
MLLHASTADLGNEYCIPALEQYAGDWVWCLATGAGGREGEGWRSDAFLQMVRGVCGKQKGSRTVNAGLRRVVVDVAGEHLDDEGDEGRRLRESVEGFPELQADLVLWRPKLPAYRRASRVCSNVYMSGSCRPAREVKKSEDVSKRVPIIPYRPHGHPRKDPAACGRWHVIPNVPGSRVTNFEPSPRLDAGTVEAVAIALQGHPTAPADRDPTTSRNRTIPTTTTRSLHLRKPLSAPRPANGSGRVRIAAVPMPATTLQ